MLREETEWLQKEIRELRARHEYTKVRGQLEALISLIMRLRCDYQESESALVRELAEDLWDLSVKACEIEVKVIREKKMATS